MSVIPPLAYQLPSGETIILGATDSLGALAMTVTTIRGVTYATVTAEGDGYLTDETMWTTTPAPTGSSLQSLAGPEAVYVPSRADTLLTARVPTRYSGTREISMTVLAGNSSYLPGVQENNVVRGPTTVPVEAAFSFKTAMNGVPARLVRIASTGAPTENVVIEERTVDFAGSTAQWGNGAPVKLIHQLSVPAASGLGHGTEYRWVLDLAEGHTVMSDVIPIWVLGDDPSCAPPDPDTVPAVTRPAIYRREASKSGRVTPVAGKAYADHQTSAVRQWKGANLNRAGAWVNFGAYNIVGYFLTPAQVASTPKYRIGHYDQNNAGYVGTGWYGNDTGARPWPRNQVAIDVPIPNHARPAHGTDRSLAIVALTADGQIDTVWEMWLARKRADGSWEAATVGKTRPSEHLQHSFSYTTAASGISGIATALLVSEARKAVSYVRAERAAGRVPSEEVIVGYADHPICGALPNPRSTVKSWPATYTDGTNSDTTVPAEGQLLYLRSDADIAAANLSPLHHVIAVLMKRRGYLITDRTNDAAIIAVEGDTAYTGTEWAAMLTSENDRTVTFPDDWFEIGKIYADQAAYVADN